MSTADSACAAGNIAKWNKGEGDEIAAGDSIAEIETDKATMDWEAQDDGFVAKLLVAEGAKDVSVGQPVIVIVEEQVSRLLSEASAEVRAVFQDGLLPGCDFANLSRHPVRRLAIQRFRRSSSAPALIASWSRREWKSCWPYGRQASKTVSLLERSGRIAEAGKDKHHHVEIVLYVLKPNLPLCRETLKLSKTSLLRMQLAKSRSRSQSRSRKPLLKTAPRSRPSSMSKSNQSQPLLLAAQVNT